MVSKVRGTFAEVTGTITVAEDPLQSAVTASIPAGHDQHRLADRDNHLRSADFLDVENYPTLDFRSTGVVSHNGNEFVLRGELTIRGVTREVDLKVEFDGVAEARGARRSSGSSATTEFDREDFGMTWNQALETGGVLVGKKIDVRDLRRGGPPAYGVTDQPDVSESGTARDLEPTCSGSRFVMT